jgi:hypothetical protein
LRRGETSGCGEEEANGSVGGSVERDGCPRARRLERPAGGSAGLIEFCRIAASEVALAIVPPPSEFLAGDAVAQNDVEIGVPIKVAGF